MIHSISKAEEKQGFFQQLFNRLREIAGFLRFDGLAGSLRVNTGSVSDNTSFQNPQSSDPLPNFKNKVCNASFEGDVDALRNYVACGVDLNARNNEGVTPIISAILGNQRGALRFLMDSGADPNQRSAQRKSPVAICIDKTRPKLLKVLLEKGANANETISIDGTTAVGSAILKITPQNQHSTWESYDDYRVAATLIWGGAEVWLEKMFPDRSLRAKAIRENVDGIRYAFGITGSRDNLAGKISSDEHIRINNAKSVEEAESILRIGKEGRFPKPVPQHSLPDEDD